MRARFHLINILYVLNHVFGQDSNLRGFGNNENRPIIYTFYANNPDEIRNTGTLFLRCRKCLIVNFLLKYVVCSFQV